MMQAVDDALSRLRTPIAILAGAGVSMDPPAGLPSARTLMEQTVTHATGGVIPPADVPYLLDRPEDFPFRPGEFLRFEVAMSQLDPHVRQGVLGTLQRGTPNRNHYVLAQLLHHGHVVITTNFDTHIEAAYRHLYGRDCAVAVRDGDFGRPPGAGSAGVLWKIHGCLTDAGSVAATFTVIFSRRSIRMRWFSDVLARHDLVVAGYSGSDDLDLVPPLAQTVTPRALLWIDHAAGAARAFTPGEWVSRGTARMHLDCVGLTRVMFSACNPLCATRSPDSARVVQGSTDVILERVLAWTGAVPRAPWGAPPRAVAGAEPSIPAPGDEYEAVDNAIALLRFRRGARVQALLDRARQALVRVGARGLPGTQLRLLVELYNSAELRGLLRTHAADAEAWRGIAENDPSAFLARLDALEGRIGSEHRPGALRLRGCLLRDTDPYAAQRCFEASLQAAREQGDDNQEISTLSTYSNLLYPSFFPMFWHQERRFPHQDRLRELQDATGFVPMIQQGDLVRGIDYAIKLQMFNPAFVEEHADVGFYDVYRDAVEWRRTAIDLGDVWGEMESTFVLAELSLAAGMHDMEVPGFSAWIEWQRLDLLAEALGAREEFGERLSIMTSLPRAEGEASREELKASMFAVRH